jgi:hypothetical protein
MSDAPNPRHRLFRAIVVLGAAMTAEGCDDDRCVRCVPPVDASEVADARSLDAGVDASGPRDAPVDVVLIL